MTLSNRRREAVIHAIVDQMTAWNPHERMGMFRKWLLGSMSIVQLHVLTILETSGPLPMGKLADALDVSVASATGIVDRLEQRGLVERRHDEADRRVILVHATQAGEAVFSDIQKQRQAGLEHVLGRLTNDELRALLIGIRALSRARSEAMQEAEAMFDPKDERGGAERRAEAST